MQKIAIKIEEKSLSFELYQKKVKEENLNNTNVITTKNLIFSSDYMEENSDLVSAFLKIIVLKNDIHEARISSLSVAVPALLILSSISSITKLYFLEDATLNYDLVERILENPYVEYINCYSMKEFLFERITQYHHAKVELRNEIFFLSDFMEENKLHTYSDIYYKKKISIKKKFEEEDFKDYENFVAINNALKQIQIYAYDEKDFETLISKTPIPVLDKLRIDIYQNEENIETLKKNIPYFRKLEKKFHCKIVIHYSKKYKENHFLKQLNLEFLKIMILGIIVACILYLVFGTKKQKEDYKHVEEVNELVFPIIEEVEALEEIEEEIDAYHTKYDEVYSKLLAINSDTIGWLRIPNTGINYPIVQARDNDYYLNHSFDRKVTSLGWIFADYRNHFDSLSKNTIFYGHDVRNTNHLFGSLHKLLDSQFYDTKGNEIISFNTRYEKMDFQIFSVYTISNTNDYLRTDFDTDELYARYLAQELGRSLYDFGVEVKEEDQILTLSTCYKDSSKRLVVHAKRIK